MSTETKGRKCEGKQRHISRKKALATLDRLVAKGAVRKWLNAYACEHCGFWHVGHRPGRRKR